MVFGNSEELINNNATFEIDNKYGDSYVIYGYDKELRLKYLKIKDVGIIEHKKITERMMESGVQFGRKN